MDGENTIIVDDDTIKLGYSRPLTFSSQKRIYVDSGGLGWTKIILCNTSYII